MVGAPRRDVHALVRHARAELALPGPPAVAQKEPPPRWHLDRDDVQIEVLDAARTSIADGAFDLVVGSPPFALDVPYADGGDVPDYSAYRELMTTWSAEL
jgi:hypothetical protein